MSCPYRTAAAPVLDCEEPTVGAYWAERSTGMVVVLVYEMPDGWWVKALDRSWERLQGAQADPWGCFRIPLRELRERWLPYMHMEAARA